MFFLQTLIHRLEEAGGSRVVRWLVILLGVALLTLAYDLRCYRNFSTQEAMDAAQLGRNIAEGRGYTTLFIRPFSMHLIQQQNFKKHGIPKSSALADYSEIRTAHPDISNPPVYPVVLAGLMKVLPFNYVPSETKPFWSNDRRFWRYQPDFLIALFGEFLFFATVVVVFYWARRLFDNAVAWTSAVLLLGSNLLWRFSVSGLSTMLLLLIFMGLVWCLTLLEAETRDPQGKLAKLFLLAAAAGVLVGLGGLTRYAFGWMIIPVLLFIGLYTGPRRVTICLTTLAAFAVVMLPWVARTYSLSGAPFGTATYSVLESSRMFPGHHLERSLSPDIRVYLPFIIAKLLVNLRLTLSTILFSLGGGWIAAFFLVGLLVAFRNPALRRMRYFLLVSLGVFAVVQALGSTQLSKDSAEINSENLLVLFLPLVLVYGVSLFFILLDQITFSVREMRYSAIAAFCVLVSLPLFFALMPPRTIPVAYPPYFPPIIRQTAGWMKPNELMMSDIPWAVAWYGNRQCVWLTLNATRNPKDPDSQENFFTINDFVKPISGLYLTPKTLDSRFLSDWVRSGDHSWGSFLMNIVLKRQLPRQFPLRKMPTGYLPEQLFLSYSQRWE